ncbi:nitrate reductase molybdenum cofactor assembly chaperone [Gilvimarinus polysaccharolyticus]|uniref:nitrate reductase molybdenum cofactor assembly chaperone n=1 Tax=Gilvimarinus polysaccharolyticus TaxID=863921 RepID=UPI0006735190|nr:nitrate reductase molybdenum cofactor assembly chaperone [Gilvimarinus polysaccharolyticus]
MESLRLVSLLMEYPTQELMDGRDELLALVASINLKSKLRGELTEFVAQRTGGDLMDWQSEYDSLFERGRSLSLLLFEHVHGESRDRGQAMVDLMDQYRQAGLEIDAKELPDYLPLYLEFLSTQGADNARAGLQEVEHILALLAARLKERECNYAALFEALLYWCGARVNLDEMRQKVATEARDDTPEALDKVWEEEMVTFGPDSKSDACNTNYKPESGQRRDQEQILNIVDPQRAQKH